MIQLWEWIHPTRKEGALTDWRAELQKSDQVLLDSKTDLLKAAEAMDTLPGFLVGPIKHKGLKYPNIFKLQLGGKLRLRPLLCKGPEDTDRELTFLVGAFEKGGDFDPKNAPATALKRREQLVTRKAGRRRYETPGKSEAN